jgi:hypothetical protein
MKNPKDPTGNQTYDPLACSTVPQQTAPQHTSSYVLDTF